MRSLPIDIREIVTFPTDALKEAVCRGLRCGIREGRAGMDKVRWLEARYAAALWSHLSGEKSASAAREMQFMEVELKEIYVSAGIAQALGIASGSEISAHELLSRLSQEMKNVVIGHA